MLEWDSAAGTERRDEEQRIALGAHGMGERTAGGNWQSAQLETSRQYRRGRSVDDGLTLAIGKVPSGRCRREGAVGYWFRFVLRP